MAEELKELIEKIHEEGVKAAEEKARAIEERAKNREANIIKNAKEEASKILENAGMEAKKMVDSGSLSLKQAARDILLALKKEITFTLDKLTALEVKDTLKEEALAKILETLVKEYNRGPGNEVVIQLSKEDTEKMQNLLFNKLTGELKKGVSLRPSDDISGGFIISYDGGKSHYDFTDKALAGYLGTYLKPKLRDMLK